MSRCTQIIGLTDKAEEWINKNCESISPIDSGNTYEGMFGGKEDTYKLYKYLTKTGREVEEYIQAEPWSSGPCFFIALRYIDTKRSILKSLWSQEEINNA